MSLSALVLCCSLKPSPEPSSTVLLAEQVLAALGEHGVTGELVRVVDHDVRPGVTTDERNGDAWPMLRRKLLRSPSSVTRTALTTSAPSCSRRSAT